MQDAHRAGNIDRAIEQQVAATVLDQPARDQVRLFAVLGWPLDVAVALHALALVGRQLVVPDRLREIRRRRQQRQCPHPLRTGQRQQQGDPAAHGRADDHLRARGQFIQHRQRITQPVADAAVRKAPAGRAVAGIVEAHEGATLLPAMLGEGGGLAAAHVGHEAATEQHAGRAAGNLLVGEAMGTAVQELHDGDQELLQKIILRSQKNRLTGSAGGF